MSRIYYICISFIILFGIFQISHEAVIGLDLGAEYIKVSSISPGKSFVIVENTATKRKTENAVAFYNNERIYESGAILKKPRAYNNTFMFMNKFLGKKFEDDSYRELSEHLLENFTFLPNERGTLSFALTNFKLTDKEQQILSIEEVVGMIISHMRELAEKQANLPIKDAVITIPPSWTFQQRYALYNAVLLAGLNPLSFIHENTAAALYYSIERFDENKTHSVLFYNLGSSGLKVSLIEFSTENSTERFEKGKKYESVNVIAEAWDDTINGYEMDLNLAKHFAKEFDSLPSRKGKPSVLTLNSAMAKLIRESNRLKETLSANKNAQLYIENLADGIDFKSSIDRSTFETINEDMFQRLTKPINEILSKSGRDLNSINAFEVLGAGVRVPKVTQTLANYLGLNEVAAHINGDESMALGAAFHAANLSSAFKTKTIYLNDGHNFDISIRITDLEPSTTSQDNTEEKGEVQSVFEKTATIFPTKTRYGTKRVISFTHDRDVKCEFTFKNEKGEDELIAIYNVTGITGINEKMNENTTSPRVNLNFRLNNFGFIELQKADITYDETQLVEDKSYSTSRKQKETKKKETQSTSDSTSSEENKADDTNASDDKTSNKDSSSSSADEKPTDLEEKQDEEKKYKKKTINHAIPCNIEEYIPGPELMTEQEIRASLKKLKKFDDYENYLKKRAEAKNNLESFIYKARDYGEDMEFVSYSTEEERERLRELASDNDDWLYSDEADNAEPEAFTQRLSKMTSITRPVLFRMEEGHSRGNTIALAFQRLNDFPKKTEDLLKTKTWIQSEQKDTFLESVEETLDWLEKMIEKQNALEKYEDPVLTANQINSKIDVLNQSFVRLKNTPKPKAGGAKNNFINFGGAEGENQFYENLRKQYGMSPDATYDEIFQEYMERNGNKFTSGNERSDDDKQSSKRKSNAEENNQQRKEQQEGQEGQQGQEQEKKDEEGGADRQKGEDDQEAKQNNQQEEQNNEGVDNEQKETPNEESKANEKDDVDEETNKVEVEENVKKSKGNDKNPDEL